MINILENSESYTKSEKYKDKVFCDKKQNNYFNTMLPLILRGRLVSKSNFTAHLISFTIITKKFLFLFSDGLVDSVARVDEFIAV